jgi:hypothetical protein
MPQQPKKPANLGNNLGVAANLLAGDDEESNLPPAEEPVQQAAPVGVPSGNDTSELGRQRAEKKVVIIVEENDHTPPNGHFVGVNGVGYQIQTGKEVTVPLSVLEVLDNAKESVPVTNEEKSVIGYRDRLRVPYRVVRYVD